MVGRSRDVPAPAILILTSAASEHFAGNRYYSVLFNQFAKSYGGDQGARSEHSDQEILRLFVVSPDPVLFASEIAESLVMTRQGVYKRIRQGTRGVVGARRQDLLPL